MSPLRLRMLEYMQLKHYSPATIKNYLSQVSHFARYLGKSPDLGTLEEVAAYLLHLNLERRLSQSQLNSAYSVSLPPRPSCPLVNASGPLAKTKV